MSHAVYPKMVVEDEFICIQLHRGKKCKHYTASISCMTPSDLTPFLQRKSISYASRVFSILPEEEEEIALCCNMEELIIILLYKQSPPTPIPNDRNNQEMIGFRSTKQFTDNWKRQTTLPHATQLFWMITAGLWLALLPLHSWCIQFYYD